MKKIIFLSITLFISASTQAAGWLTSDGSARITSISIEGGFVKVAYTASSILNPDDCGNEGFFILQDDTKNGDRQYSALLAAHMANKSIKLYANGCFIAWGQTWQKLWSVFVE